MYLHKGALPPESASAHCIYILSWICMEDLLRHQTPSYQSIHLYTFYIWTGDKSRLTSQSQILNLYFVIHCTNETTQYFVNSHWQYQLVHMVPKICHLHFLLDYLFKYTRSIGTKLNRNFPYKYKCYLLVSLSWLVNLQNASHFS